MKTIEFLREAPHPGPLPAPSSQGEGGEDQGQRQDAPPSARAFSLIECLVYISVLGVILAIGSLAFYRCWDDNKAIARNGAEIVHTLKAGEAWRADLRSATGPIQITTTNSEQTIRIPCGNRELAYTFANGEVRKQTGKNNPWQLVLTRVKSSQMQPEKRAAVTAWRWEVELQPERKHARVHPLFTFEAVPGNSFSR